MKRITRLFVAVAALFALTFGSVASAAPRPEQKNKAFEIRGRVLKVDDKARTILVSDHWSKKLYLVACPEGATFQITFGRNMKLTYAGIEHLDENNRVRIRVRHTGGERLTLLQDGRQALVLIASR